MSENSTTASQLLTAYGDGDSTALDRLLPLVYDELHALAAAHLRGERPDHTLQATALVHEAYLRLVGQTQVSWNSRAHFMALAAQAIRRVLVDHARRRQAAKRGSGGSRLTLHDGALLAGDPLLDVQELDEAIKKLAGLDPRQGQVVELRFFGGLSVDEAAQVLGVSPRTVEGDWHMAKAWLKRALSAS